MPQTKTKTGGVFRAGTACSHGFARQMDARRGVGDAGRRQHGFADALYAHQVFIVRNKLNQVIEAS